MGADEGRKTEDREQADILEEMIQLQADLMVLLKDVLNELTLQAGEGRTLTGRGSRRGLSSSYSRAQHPR
ncbi:MAG: hypothetical protein WEB06_03735 [Actinomycetota bacterium]